MRLLPHKGRQAETDEVPEYWITYSDLMVSLLMTFALLLFLAMARVQAEVSRADRIVKANNQAIKAAATSLVGSGATLDSATGALTINEKVLFDYGSAALKPQAVMSIQAVARRFIPALLAQPSVDSLMQEISIEGHTDTVGTYMSNLQLSQQRAYSVMRAMVESTYGEPYADRLRTLIVASGKSEMRPVWTAGSIDAARSRRIEIHIRFRDDAILQQVIEAARATQVRQM